MPTPLISWNHDDVNLTDQYKNTPRYMLEVNNINMSGVVECVANNGVGEPASSSINLIVLCKNHCVTLLCLPASVLWTMFLVDLELLSLHLI